MVHKIMANNDNENAYDKPTIILTVLQSQHVRFLNFQRYKAKTGIAKNSKCCFHDVLSDGIISGGLWPHRSPDLNREIFVFGREDKG